MPESRQNIDALLAETERLASEAERQLGSVCQQQPPGAANETRAAPAAPPATDRARLQHILRIEVPVIVNLAERTMPLRDVIRLSTGSVLEFDKPADAELSLLVNNKCIAYGKAVRVGENFGLNIRSIRTPQERLGALSPSINDA